MFQSEAPISQSKDVVYSRVEEDLVLLNVANDQTYGLNFVASFIWECLEEPGITARAIVARLVDRYAVEESRAHADLEALLTSFHEERLIRIG